AFFMLFTRDLSKNENCYFFNPSILYKPEFDSYFEFRTLVDSEFRVKIAKTGRALSSNFYDENRFSQVLKRTFVYKTLLASLKSVGL
ncbi:MAG: hypothetical protein ACI8ZN_002140, partial [Bacteroidia bacterium]